MATGLTRRRFAVFAVSCICMAAAWPGTLTEARLSGQPLQYAKAGAITGCGVRIVGMPDAVQGLKTVDMFDVSFNVTDPGAGMVKGGLMQVPIKAILEQDFSKRTEVPISNFWLKTAGSGATVPIGGGVQPAQSHKHALMYVTALEPMLDLVRAVHQRQPIQVGFKPKNQDIDVAFFGPVQMSDGEREQFFECFAEWSGAVQRRLDAKSPASSVTGR